MSDNTPDEIDGYNYSRIKAVLTAKISQADYLLVVIGSNTNTRHPRGSEISERNGKYGKLRKLKNCVKKLLL